MEAVKSQQGTVAVIAVNGAVVVEELDSLRSKLEECFAGGSHNIVLDLREVPFVDSAGLELIQQFASDAVRRGGELAVSSMNNICEDIFDATRLSNRLRTFEGRDSAVRGLL